MFLLVLILLQKLILFYIVSICTAINQFTRVRYLLDNFATVEEAIDGMEAIKINKAELCWTSDNMEIGVHLALQDATGKIYVLIVV